MSLSLINKICHDPPIIPFHSIRIPEKLLRNQIALVNFHQKEKMYVADL